MHSLLTRNHSKAHLHLQVSEELQHNFHYLTGTTTNLKVVVTRCKSQPPHLAAALLPLALPQCKGDFAMRKRLHAARQAMFIVGS